MIPETTILVYQVMLFLWSVLGAKAFMDGIHEFRQQRRCHKLGLFLLAGPLIWMLFIYALIHRIMKNRKKKNG